MMRPLLIDHHFGSLPHHSFLELFSAVRGQSGLLSAAATHTSANELLVRQLAGETKKAADLSLCIAALRGFEAQIVIERIATGRHSFERSAGYRACAVTIFAKPAIATAGEPGVGQGFGHRWPPAAAAGSIAGQHHIQQCCCR